MPSRAWTGPLQRFRGHVDCRCEKGLWRMTKHSHRQEPSQQSNDPSSSVRPHPAEVGTPHPRTNVGTIWTSYHPACIISKMNGVGCHVSADTSHPGPKQARHQEARNGPGLRNVIGCGCERVRAPEDEISLLQFLLGRRVYDRLVPRRWCEYCRVYRAASTVGGVQR